MSRKAICLDIPAATSCSTRAKHIALRNAVAMRGHIKPVMVPFSCAITRLAVISAGYLVDPAVRQIVRSTVYTDISFAGRVHRPYCFIVSILRIARQDPTDRARVRSLLRILGNSIQLARPPPLLLRSSRNFGGYVARVSRKVM